MTSNENYPADFIGPMGRHPAPQHPRAGAENATPSPKALPNEGPECRPNSGFDSRDGGQPTDLEVMRNNVRSLQENDRPALRVSREHYLWLAERVEATTWTCKAQRTADLPQDCDWPFCGCDPYAERVLSELVEHDLKVVRYGNPTAI